LSITSSCIDFADNCDSKPSFSLSNSSTKKTKPINTKYELIYSLYNLAVWFHIKGFHLITGPNVPDKIKGMQRLRSALWCLNETKTIMSTLLSNSTEITSDINSVSFELLENYMIGLVYSTLAEVMRIDSTRKAGPEKLASTNNTAAKFFQKAFDITNVSKQSFSSQKKNLRMKMNLLYNLTMSRSEAYLQTSNSRSKE